MARAARRRQAEEELQSERERADTLREEIERLVGELDGPRIDEAAFARMDPEDAAIVRELVQAEELPEDETEGWLTDDDGEVGEALDPRAEAEEEIARLQGEVAESSRRQQALERYLEALG